ncbi:hypothetical protein FRC04_006690 [Tulasnella sp. 424]|nr:hypothetical protein FRC04_006690 [Tulasnella sp. 424]KAG8966728.1 hypothetical protein FRC05_002441 [Tulasnella sp. 425]
MVTTRGKRVNYAALEVSDDDVEMAAQGGQDEEPKERRKPATKRRKSKHNEGDEEFDMLAPAPKAVKGKAKRRSTGKARAAVLDGFMDIPLDVFAELCTELTPLDLLQLARSTRRLREILMSKGSKSIWKRARANIEGLPDCPEDLSEPQYASLMFEVGCQSCHKGTRKTDYQLRIRLCNSCLDTRLMTQKHMYGIWHNMPWEVSEHIPHSWYGNKKLYLINVFNKARDELLGEDGKIKKELQIGVAERLRKFSQMMYDTGNAMQEWKEERAHTQQLHKLILCDEREHKVMEKLIEKGWERDDMPMMSVEWDTLVYKPVPLTDQIWRRIYPKLIPALEVSRAERLIRERQERRMERMEDFYDLYSDYIAGRLIQDSSLSRGHFLLAVDLLTRVPELQTQLYDEDEPHYTAEKWDKHLEAVGRVNDEYKVKALGLLKAVVEKGTGAGVVIKKEERSVEPEEGQAGPSTSKSTSPTAPTDLSSLNAITTIFKCTVCHDRLWYPEVLQHTCCRGKVNLSLAHYFEGYDDDVVFDDGLEDAFHFYAMAAFGYTYQRRARRNTSSSEPFNVDTLVVDSGRWQKMVRAALRDVGLPENATTLQVEAEGKQFTSLLCSGGADRNEAWSFREVIAHNCSRHDMPSDESRAVIKRDQTSDELQDSDMA